MDGSNAAEAIVLHFQDVVRVAGETITGSIDLNLRLAQEERIEKLRIKYRGVISTRITTQNGQQRITHRQTVPLIHSGEIFWETGSAFPLTATDVISFPFHFTLPPDLPPSFHCDGHSRGGTISYALEVVGDRPGLFRSNRRLRRVFVVVPPAFENQMLVVEQLRQGWEGGWRDIKQNEQLRKGIWGEYSRAFVTLTIPDITSLPIGVPIPFNLQIMTETKTLDRTDSPQDKHGKPIFPALPEWAKLEINLRRRTQIRVRNRMRTVEDEYDLKGIRSPAHANKQPVDALVDEPEWVLKEGDDKNRGFWRRRVTFNSTLAFPFAPSSTNAEILQWFYKLHITVPFSGLTNDLNLELAVHLGPSALLPPPPIGVAGSSSGGMTYADVVPEGRPPPMYDLPPDYWTGEHHDWDEKN
ncbi:arrestin-N domain-containing protein [Favolaschia claudopus]|uniref:Arrestin-N domain-containing protein n=1 Tax=Favolaschia claudopus TaxID=2862362 RepID=A0AAW0CII3_9AGAR